MMQSWFPVVYMVVFSVMIIQIANARSTKITVQVKSPKEKQSVEIEENATVKKFKEAISLKFSNAPVENLFLIFAGKIMKDAENLNTHHVKDGMTVHLVIKQSGSAAKARGGKAVSWDFDGHCEWHCADYIGGSKRALESCSMEYTGPSWGRRSSDAVLSECNCSRSGMCRCDDKVIPECGGCDTPDKCGVTTTGHNDDGSVHGNIGKKECRSDQHGCQHLRSESQVCLDRKDVCDGYEDCPYGDDEHPDCVYECRSDQFGCAYTGSSPQVCLYRSEVCDGSKDCPSGDDETHVGCQWRWARGGD